MPLTRAPRRAAVTATTPEPHPTSSTDSPGATFANRTSSAAGGIVDPLIRGEIRPYFPLHRFEWKKRILVSSHGDLLLRKLELGSHGSERSWRFARVPPHCVKRLASIVTCRSMMQRRVSVLRRCACLKREGGCMMQSSMTGLWKSLVALTRKLAPSPQGERKTNSREARYDSINVLRDDPERKRASVAVASFSYRKGPHTCAVAADAMDYSEEHTKAWPALRAAVRTGVEMGVPRVARARI